MGLLDKWNNKRFSVFESEEKTVLGLVQNIHNFNEDIAKEVDSKVTQGSNFTGSWQGIKYPTLSEEGLRGTVEKITNTDLPQINKQLEEGTFYITPEMFGGKGDGVTDDTQAFINAFNVANKIFLDGSKSYLINGVVDCSTKKGISIEGNGATLIHPRFNIGMNGNTWRYPYQGEICYFKNLNIVSTKDNPYGNVVENSFKPVITSGSPVVLENILSTNMLTLVCYPDVYMDKMIFKNVSINKNKDLVSTAVLNAFCRLLQNGNYANIGTANISAGDGFYFENCQEIYIQGNPNYNLIETDSMQSVTFKQCIQCSVKVNRFTIAIFDGCHFEQAAVTSVDKSGSIITFNNCFFYPEALRKHELNVSYNGCQIHYDLYRDFSTSAMFDNNVTFTNGFGFFKNCQGFYNPIDTIPNYWNDLFSTNTWLNAYMTVEKINAMYNANNQSFDPGTYEMTVYLLPKKGYTTSSQYKYSLTYELTSKSNIGLKLTNTAGFWVVIYLKSTSGVIYSYEYQLPRDFNGSAVFNISKLLAKVDFSNTTSVIPFDANQIIATKKVNAVPSITVNDKIVCINNVITTIT